MFLAGLVTALATGLGAVPVFFDESSDRRNVVLWGFSSGIMVSASVFGLLEEGLAAGTPLEISVGVAAGVVLVGLGLEGGLPCSAPPSRCLRRS